MSAPQTMAGVPLRGTDCWLPHRRVAIDDLLRARLDGADLIRVIFADVEAPCFQRWSDTGGYSGRWFAPDLVIADFHPARSAIHSRLLRLAAGHREADDLMVALVRHPDLVTPSAARSNAACCILGRLGVPVFASCDPPEPTELLIDLAGPECTHAFDWGDLRQVFGSGPIAAYSCGTAATWHSDSIHRAVLACASRFEEQGIDLQRAAGMMLTVYTEDMEAVYSALRHAKQLLGSCSKLVKWNKGLGISNDAQLHVIAVGPFGDAASARSSALLGGGE